MIEQEETKEGIRQVIEKYASQIHFDPRFDELTGLIWDYLHSQDVVIMVGRELSEESSAQLERDMHQVLIKYLNGRVYLFDATQEIREIFDKAGYEAVESLVMEEPNVLGNC